MRHLQIALLLLTLLDLAEGDGAGNYTRHNASTCLPMCVEEVHCECVVTLMQTAGQWQNFHQAIIICCIRQAKASTRPYQNV